MKKCERYFSSKRIYFLKKPASPRRAAAVLEFILAFFYLRPSHLPAFFFFSFCKNKNKNTAQKKEQNKDEEEEEEEEEERKGRGTNPGGGGGAAAATAARTPSPARICAALRAMPE